MLRQYLESTTIHGLSYIASPRKPVKFLWILIVVSGFSTAGFLIYESIQSWKESPITTTIKILPIEEIRFPKVTVCPPKNTFTSLNYDLEYYANTTLDEDSKVELLKFVLSTVDDAEYKKFMEYFDIIQVENIFLNLYWQVDSFESSIMDQSFSNKTDPNAFHALSLVSRAPNGIVQTKDFGQTFQDSFVKNLDFKMTLMLPDLEANETMFEIHTEQVTSNDFQFLFNEEKGKTGDIVRNRYFSKAVIDEQWWVSIEYKLEILDEDIERMEIDKMLGFRISWNHSRSLYDTRYVPKRESSDMIAYAKNQTRRYFDSTFLT